MRIAHNLPGTRAVAEPIPTPAYCRPDAYFAFARQLPRVDTTGGLFQAACAIAQHERPEADVDAAAATIDELAETVRRRARSALPQAKLAHLHDVLFEVVGLRGNVDDYYCPSNSYVPDVLKTRRGLPITLTLIYKCVAEGVGLAVHGINAPGHFLASVRCPGSNEPSHHAKGWMYVDPFYGGDLLDERQVYQRVAQTTGRPAPLSSNCLARATHRQWLSRMLANLQAVFASTGRERDLYAMQELQNLLAE
jgi:regulator of sirC expression with transglutaminase-like and TPR domain